MVNLIDEIINALPSAQANAILRLINEKSKTATITRRELSDEFDQLKLEQNAVAGSPMFSPRLALPGRKISSDDLNYNMERIYVDLGALYDSMNKINLSFESFSATSEDEFIKLRSAILKIIQQTLVFKFLRDNRQYQDVKIIDFTQGLNETEFSPKAKIDSDIHALELQPRERLLHQAQNRGFRTTNADIVNIGGGTVSTKNDTFGPEKMLDRIPGTFWAEMVLSDVPIHQKYQTSAPLGNEDQILDVFGPIAEVHLDFSHPEECNHVRILPFGDFPVRIVDLAYKETAESSIWHRIPDFTATTDTINSWYEVNFDTLTIAGLRISIAQESYTQNVYHLPKSLVYSTNILQHVIDETFRRDIGDQGRISNELGDIITNNKTSLYLEALDDLEKDLLRKYLDKNPVREFKVLEDTVESLSKIMSRIDPSAQDDILQVVTGRAIHGQENLVSIKKFQYIYGIREIEIGFSIYKPIGLYASPRYITNATVTDIELEVDEYNITFEDQWGEYHRSTVEYEIEIGPNRKIPIVPKNHTGDAGELLIRDEYMQIDRNTSMSTTRFQIASTDAILRKNGTYVPVSQYDFSGNTSGFGELQVSGFSPNAIYHLTYKPISGSSYIDVLDRYNSELVVPEERFINTGPDNRITLEAYPYVEYEVINQTGLFVQDDENIAKWRWNSPLEPYTSGVATFSPKIVATTGTAFNGDTAVFMSTGDLVSTLTGYGSAPYEYEIRFRDFNFSNTISGFVDATGLNLNSIPEITENTAQEFGSAYNSTNGQIQSDYVINVGYRTDGIFYGLVNPDYEPLVITVNGTKAENLTNYRTREHKAFSGRQRIEDGYQFIHRGKNIFFNKPISGEILVTYRWITKYIRLRSALVNLQPVNSVVTPQVHEAKLLLKTTPL